MAPFSARGAAAQALCRGAFPRKHDEPSVAVGTSDSSRSTANDETTAGGLSLGGADADDDRGDVAADGEPYVWHCSLADGGLVALATPSRCGTQQESGALGGPGGATCAAPRTALRPSNLKRGATTLYECYQRTSRRVRLAARGGAAARFT